MKKHISRIVIDWPIVIKKILILFFMSFSTVVIADDNANQPVSLFTEITVNTSTDISIQSNQKAITQKRLVKVNTDYLLTKSSLNSIAQKEITISLFDGITETIRKTKLYENASGSSTWIGTVDNVANSTVMFIINKNKTVFGTIELAGIGKFSIRPLDDSTHTIEQVNEAMILTGDTDVRIPSLPSLRALARGVVARSVEISNDDGSIIDVYIAYDQDDSGGSVEAATAQALAELFIAYTNQTYENSGINQRVWLVGTVDGYNYTDNNTSSVQNELHDVTSTTDGLIDDIHAKRDEYHADLVVFLSPYTEGSFCGGIAWLQTGNNNLSFNTSAFSTMNACSFGTNIFAHEIGHNMGGRHDWYADNGITPASIGHGYVDTTNNFITVMAYDTRCTVLGIACSRIPNFSNPNVFYNGHPTGISANTSSACDELDPSPATDCDADNAGNFNNTALTTSGFRDSRLTWTGAVSSSWSESKNWLINEGAPGATTPVNRTPRAFDNVYIPAGLDVYPTITGTAAARELTIEAGASLNMTSGELTVSWSWEDEGGFNSTGGEVIFDGPIGLGITSSSSFQDVQIGDGSNSSLVTLENNIDIDGDLHINASSTLRADTYTINLAGDWTESDASGFDAGTGLVVFDGNNQSIDKTTTLTLLDESFSAYDLSCCTTGKPDSWSNSDGSYFQGDLISDGNGAANRWRNQTDGYLYTPALSLQLGITYQLHYSVAARRNFSDGDRVLSPQTISVHLGDSQSSSSMTEQLDDEYFESSTSYQSRTVSNITVASSGNYYIGFRAQQSGDDYTSFDDISLTGLGSLSFNDLQIVSGTSTFNADVNVGNDLLINDGASAIFESNTLSVVGDIVDENDTNIIPIIPIIPIIIDLLLE